MRTIVIDPSTGPKLVDLNEDLPTYQRLVGGYIEPIPLGNDAIAYVNEEGKLYGLPWNMWMTLVMRSVGIPDDYAVGVAVIVGRNDPAATDAPDWVCDLLGLAEG